jgi:hypothetical protein
MFAYRYVRYLANSLFSISRERITLAQHDVELATICKAPSLKPKLKAAESSLIALGGAVTPLHADGRAYGSM